MQLAAFIAAFTSVLISCFFNGSSAERPDSRGSFDGSFAERPAQAEEPLGPKGYSKVDIADRTSQRGPVAAEAKRTSERGAVAAEVQKQVLEVVGRTKKASAVANHTIHDVPQQLDVIEKLVHQQDKIQEYIPEIPESSTQGSPNIRLQSHVLQEDPFGVPEESEEAVARVEENNSTYLTYLHDAQVYLDDWALDYGLTLRETEYVFLVVSVAECAITILLVVWLSTRCYLYMQDSDSFQCRLVTDKMLSILAEPDITSQVIGALSGQSVFWALDRAVLFDGRTYFRLHGRRGWVPECSRKDGSKVVVVALDDEISPAAKEEEPAQEKPQTAQQQEGEDLL